MKTVYSIKERTGMGTQTEGIDLPERYEECRESRRRSSGRR